MLNTYSGATRVIFIVGDPIAQVKSPASVTAALREQGADAVVVPAQVKPQDLAGFMATVGRMPNVDGVIVTVPHKMAVAGLCQEVAGRARSIGAVNIVRRGPGGGWFGDMCDGEGYVARLRELNFEPRGRRALLVGAGGAGSAIAHALVDAGVAAIALHDIDLTRRDQLAARLRAYGPARVETGSADPTDFDLAINATPMGMQPHDPLPIEAGKLSAATFVGDVVTVPEITPLLALARARGCASLTGMDMFRAVSRRIVDFYLPQP